MDIQKAKEKLLTVNKDNKYETMITTAAIITKLLEPQGIKPIIVGGLSVEIYTQREYTTRDIDFVSDGRAMIEEVLFSLEFVKEGRHYYNLELEVAIEIPDNYLEGDINKIAKVDIGNDLYIYLISLEDIILDRLRAAVHWRSEEDSIWGFTLLVQNIESINTEYLLEKVVGKQEIGMNCLTG